MDKEIKTLRKKIEAGMDFAMSQPIYDARVAREFLERYAAQHGPLPIPVLAGVMPLYNLRNANFLHNEVPGVSIPERLRERMAEAGTSGPEEGVRIAQELLAELQDVLQCAYLIPQFGRYDLVAQIIDAVRAKSMT